ncbi:MAG TPA: hypothetical protein PLY69_10280 [Bacteroidales bacterium]|nr:hypothetical protein [Bacteroidales bacterium]
MELKITKKDFDNLSSLQKLKVISLCFELLSISDNTVILSTVEINSDKELIRFLEGNWGVLKEFDKIYLP